MHVYPLIRTYSYRQTAELLNIPLSSLKSRIRDGIIRMRDCWGVR